MELKGTDFSFITRRFVKEINDFLSSFSDSIPIETPNGDRGVENAGFRNEVRSVLNSLPNLDDNISANRAGDRRKYITYSPIADVFQTFRLTNFKGTLNDSVELEWFKKYAEGVPASSGASLVSAVYPLVKTLRRDGNMLLKCTTTTFNNQKYMVGNYCAKLVDNINFCPINPDYSSQKAAIFDSKEIDDKFDSYLSTKIIPIRGYVRYNKYGKRNAIGKLNKMIAAKGVSYPPVILSAIILSTFIKGKCMEEEAEYRFIMINKFSFTNALDIEAEVDRVDFSFEPSDLSKNPFYCGEGCKGEGL